MSRSASFSSAKSEASPRLDPESLNRWVVAFCVIRFDLERGQVMEECYPPNCLSHDEELEVSFSSFPDSVSQHQNRTSIHDSMFFFRLRRRQTEEKDSSFIYGYVFNRERHDERLRRGGDQKSVVILSRDPFSAVFRPLLQIMAPLYFDVGKKALEHVAGFVSAWPAPDPGRPMELPIGNATLRVSLPQIRLFDDSDVFGTFRGLLLQLWVLWELVLVGEPVLVIAPTPAQCSEAVAGLVSLVAPLLCSVDFRPYFTIHSPEFARLNSLRDGDPFPPVVLGVTNLFFLKSLRNIPHVVSVGNPNPSPSSARIPKRFGLQSLLSAVKLRRDGPLCLMTEHREAIWTGYSASTKPDTSVLNRLVDAGLSPRIEESMSVVNNEILRRHFLELTTNFLAPFGPCFGAVVPSEVSSPFVDPPPLAPFNADEFLAALSARGPGKFMAKRMRSNWLDLYRRFLKGPNFIPWFQRRRSVAEQEQQRLWRQARMKADIHQIIAKMPELEIVDSFNAIERHILAELQLQQSGKAIADTTVAFQKLKSDLKAVFNVLPKDVQQLLLLNPEKAALLQPSPEQSKKLPGRPFVQQLGVVSSPR